MYVLSGVFGAEVGGSYKGMAVLSYLFRWVPISLGWVGGYGKHKHTYFFFFFFSSFFRSFFLCLNAMYAQTPIMTVVLCTM